MTDRPIIFRGPMVQALLAGRKTQTRRIISTKGQANLFNGQWADSFVLDPGNIRWRADHVRYAPGDRLYVREAHSLHGAHGQDFVPGGFDHGKRWGPWSGLPIAVSPDKTQVAYYREGFDRSGPPKWRPSIHMPRWASRLTLIVTEVRVQRLQDISEADAVAEGITALPNSNGPNFYTREIWRHGLAIASHNTPTAVGCFRGLWEDIHDPDAWGENPWVVALTFTVHRGNIDTMGGRDE